MSFSSKPNKKKKIFGKTLVVNIGCSCRRPKLSDAFRPKAKPKTTSQQHQKPHFHRSSSTSSWERSGGFSINDEDDNTTTTTTTSFSPYLDTTPATHSEQEGEETHFNTIKCSSDSKMVKGLRRIEESVAVVKDSDDPYLDFRQSMLQMILEKELYSREDLRDLLDRFLQLNSPYHHGIIVRAFSEIWNGVFSSVNKQRFSSSSGLASNASTTPLKQRRKSREF
ncbi:transcription repressor OFP8-like [Telopea speciosissima]|uniref:transcription repressor OFP8-like n=1 Tax=Telopea speciosissima TaxID=54955 RepID=UPI001CC66A55|nr:transcription repressor OFP8-like [Telopea speciosissima]